MAERHAVVVAAAGASERMGGAGKKEYRLLSGIPVLALATLPFIRLKRFNRILIVVPPGDIQEASGLLKGHVPVDGLCFVEGGSTRQASVFRALRDLADDPPSLVLIHDGARPWVSEELIRRVESAADRFGACVPVVEPTEAVKLLGESGFIVQSLHRGSLGLAQTPQGFDFQDILSAHERADREGRRCADDAELYERYIGPVATIPGEIANRKITFIHDMEEA
jgi:2-C-methyl-D-erythritol 4-phosphate cytidylyltransferase